MQSTFRPTGRHAKNRELHGYLHQGRSLAPHPLLSLLLALYLTLKRFTGILHHLRIRQLAACRLCCRSALHKARRGAQHVLPGGVVSG